MANAFEKLKKIPLFQAIPENELSQIDKQLKEVTFAKGAIIISEGEVGDCLYLIKTGQVKVIAELKDEAEEIILSYLSKGDYFGEMSLITGEPRSATVIAESDVKLWQLDKKNFDALMLNNPSITISLTHMLSQRLRMANKARESSERYYKHQIAPRGNLTEIGVIKLLKYAEENSLTGEITLVHNEKNAIFHYQKGQLEALEFEEKDEGEAMDEILEWENGEFIIEPRVFKIAEQIEEEKPEDVLRGKVTCQYFEQYLMEKFAGFIRFSGSRITQSTLNKSFHKFRAYFSVADDFKIITAPEFVVKIEPETSWTEKHTLFLAVLLRDVVETLSRDLVGIDFWSVRSADAEVDDILTRHSFYEYFNQAADFINE